MGKPPPPGPKPFADGTLLVLLPSVDARATGVDPGQLHQQMRLAAAEQGKGLKVIPDAELAKAAAERGVKIPKSDRYGEQASILLRDLGAEYAIFAVVDKAETTGTGLLIGMVNQAGDRSANWVPGPTEALALQLPREVGALLQDLGASPTNAVKYPSGLVLEVADPGKGPRPRATDRVKVDYEGKLENGTVFDSTKKRGEPAVFGLDRVIACWNEAMAKLRPGSKAKMECPPAIAYGERGQPPSIPPNATLHFDVELLGIEK